MFTSFRKNHGKLRTALNCDRESNPAPLVSGLGIKTSRLVVNPELHKKFVN